MHKKGQNNPSPIPSDHNAGNPQSRNQSQSSSSSKPEDALTSSELTLSCYSFRSSQELKTPSPETTAQVTTVTSSGEKIQNPNPPKLSELPLERRHRADKAAFVTSQLIESPVIGAGKLRDSFYCHAGAEGELGKLTSRKLTSRDKPEELV